MSHVHIHRWIYGYRPFEKDWFDWLFHEPSIKVTQLLLIIFLKDSSPGKLFILEGRSHYRQLSVMHGQSAMLSRLKRTRCVPPIGRAYARNKTSPITELVSVTFILYCCFWLLSYSKFNMCMYVCTHRESYRRSFDYKCSLKFRLQKFYKGLMYCLVLSI